MQAAVQIQTLNTPARTAYLICKYQVVMIKLGFMEQQR